MKTTEMKTNDRKTTMKTKTILAAARVAAALNAVSRAFGNNLCGTASGFWFCRIG
jgi:hypothetical protein